MYKKGDKVKLVTNFGRLQDTWPIGSIYEVEGFSEGYVRVINDRLRGFGLKIGHLEPKDVIKFIEPPKSEEDYYTWLANRNK